MNQIHRRFGLLEDDMLGEGVQRDPLTGRFGYEDPGDIWKPRLRGRFRTDRFEIDLFGYVYDESRLRVPEVQTVLLWLEQALTFAHEVAHGWDTAARSARDRWALDEVDRAEGYAEDTGREWTKTVATKFFAQAHPDKAEAFDAWIVEHVGVAISLERIVEDFDRVFGVSDELLEICAKWGDIAELDARVDIAEALHFVDEYQPARDILETVLAAAPAHVGATILMGDIAVHEDLWAEALRWTEKAIQLAPSEPDAHRDRIDALMGAEDWAGAAEACGPALELLPNQKDAAHSSIRLDRARCLMELGDFERAGEDLDHVIAHGRPPRASAARAFRAEWLVRQGRWSEGRDESEKGLEGRPYPWHQALLRVAGWEAGKHLGTAEPKPIPTSRDFELLRWNGRGAWVERLIGMGLRPALDRPTRRSAERARRLRGQLVRI